MPEIDLHKKKPFDAATITKLDIFENYLTEWLPTFLFQNLEIHICDFFAGPGKDICGNLGSPLRIFNVLEKYETKILEQGVVINVILNEQKKNKYEDLRNNIEERISTLHCSLRKLLKVQIYNCDFQDLFPTLEYRFLEGPNLFFFDQNGVKQVTIDFIHHLERFDKTDYLFFLSSSYFKRFEFENIFPDLHIDMAEIDFREVHRAIVEKLRDALPEYSKTRLYHYSIKKGRNIYGLVFGSTHLLAVEKFLKVAWNKNKINGEANFDIDHDLDNQLDLFTCQRPKATKVQRFEKELKSFAVNRKRFTNEDVFIYTLEKGFTPQHATEIMRKMRNSKVLSHFSHAKIGYRQIYTNKQIITFEYIK